MPQLPAPRTVTFIVDAPIARDVSGGVGWFLAAEARDLSFRAVEQSLDVGAVGVNEEERYPSAEKDEGLVAMHFIGQNIVPNDEGERKGDRCHDGSKGDVAECIKNDQEHTNGYDELSWCNAQ